MRVIQGSMKTDFRSSFDRLRTNGYGLYRRLSDCSASAEPCLSWARRGVESRIETV